jgi:hypothetical protein
MRRREKICKKKISPLSLEKRRGEKENMADLNKQGTNREYKK